MLPFALAGTIAISSCTDIDRENYNDHLDHLKSEGLLRTDRDPEDAPFTRDDLIDAFAKVGFGYEFFLQDGEVVQGEISKPLSRWIEPVRYQVIGDGASQEDSEFIEEFFRRIQDMTGVGVKQVQRDANMMISIATQDGETLVMRKLLEEGKIHASKQYRAWRETPNWLCGATIETSAESAGEIRFVHVFLSAGTTGLARWSCLHEEIVQGFGLSNDADIRPSIFNDDMEFALLTRHDELLLMALYDERLRPGTWKAEAMPVAAEVFADLCAEFGCD